MDTSDEIANEIERHLREAPAGLSVTEIRSHLPRGTSARQVRYRLDALIEAGRVRTEGERRWRRYFAAQALPLSAGAASDEMFSAASQAVIDTVLVPIVSRAPVGYDIALLDGYRPNESRLLDREVVDRLNRLGRTPQADAVAGTFARQVMERMVIDIAWASSNLEGNTYSLLDTRNLIERGEAAEGKDLLETQMILNHKRAVELLIEDVVDLIAHARVIQNLHAVLVENLLADDNEAGRVRRRAVGITSSAYTPLSNPQRLEETFHRTLALARAIEEPLEQSFFLFVHLAYLQPFIDGNKRTARLAANIPLARANMRPLTFVDVPRDAYLSAILALYETTRLEPIRDLFVWAYERSCARYETIVDVVADPDPFRLRHRDVIYAAVRDIVVNSPSDVEARVEEMAVAGFSDIADRARFIGLVMADLSQLHEGNYMRYRITPREFEQWSGA